MAHFTNAQLAQNINDLIADDVAIKTEFQAWLAGTIGGGPNSDGQFPLTDHLGTTRLTTCPAQMEDDVDNNVTGSLAHKDAAETAQTAAELAQSLAETAQALSETAQVASVVAKDASVVAQTAAEDARATAIAQAAAAAADAILTAADVVLTAADVVSTNADVVTTNADVVLTAADVVLTGLDVTYAAEWANAVEDLLISAAAGGDQVDDFSALHHAAKAAATAAAIGDLDSLSDVTVVAAADKHALMVDGAGEWKNRVLVEADISNLQTYELADATILKDADIGVTVEAFDAEITKGDVTEVIAAVWTFNARPTIDAAIWMSNNQQFQPANAAGQTRSSLQMDASDILQIGDAQNAAVIRALSLAVNPPAGDGEIALNATGGARLKLDSTATGKQYEVNSFTDGKLYIGETGVFNDIMLDSNVLMTVATKSLFSHAAGLDAGGANDITPTAGGAGQLRIMGAGYTGYAALNATAMYFGHNSSARDLILQTNETDRLKISGAGAINLLGTVAIEDTTTWANAKYLQWDDAAGTPQNMITFWSDDTLYLGVSGFPTIIRGSTITIGGNAVATVATNWNAADIIAGTLAVLRGGTGVTTKTGTGSVVLSAAPTFTGESVFATIRANMIYPTAGQHLVLQAGEAETYSTGQTNELVYVNAESGLQINSSPDNWASAWAGRNIATINNAAGHSYLPGRLHVGGDIIGYLTTVTGTYGSVQCFGAEGAGSTWQGYSIAGRHVLMDNNSTTVGVYNDTNNEWMWTALDNGGMTIYYNGVAKFLTTSLGGTLTGTWMVTGDIDANGNIVGDGASTITGFETIIVDSTGDITKSGHGNYLYHHNITYNDDQEGGITFSTTAASGGADGDIWFRYV